VQQVQASAPTVATAVATAAATAPAAGPAQVVATPRSVSSELISHHERGSQRSEEYRALRTSLLAQCGSAGFCYIVTSAEAGEGKTVTCLNLALVLTECVNQNVLVVDCDLRRGRVAQLLGIEQGPGMADVMRGKASIKQVLRPTQYPNMSVITAGRANPQEVAELGCGEHRDGDEEAAQHEEQVDADPRPVHHGIAVPHDGVVEEHEGHRQPPHAVEAGQPPGCRAPRRGHRACRTCTVKAMRSARPQSSASSTSVRVFIGSGR
jgi:hypothetical protein